MILLSVCFIILLLLLLLLPSRVPQYCYITLIGFFVFLIFALGWFIASVGNCGFHSSLLNWPIVVV